MSLIREGGIPTTSSVTVASAATLLAPSRYGAPFRSRFTVQNVGSVDFFVGGSDVTATGAKTGQLVIAQASATVIPDRFSSDTSPHAFYAITASGSGTARVYEELAGT